VCGPMQLRDPGKDANKTLCDAFPF
jgi:hypothetical protein